LKPVRITSGASPDVPWCLRNVSCRC